MQGKKAIIDQLNALLAYELAAMDQYFILKCIKIGA
jgi:bacterioferritin